MPDFLAGLRQSIRSLARSPSYAVAAVLTLGLGMGASASIYTLLQRVVFDPLPYPNPAQLVRLKNAVPGVGKGTEWEMSTAQFFYYASHVHAISKIGTYRLSSANIETSGQPQRALRAAVSASMMSLLGASPARGRLIGPDDDVPSAPTVAVLSYGFWRSQFGGDSSIVGQTIRLNDYAYQVIGVMAKGVELPPDRGEAVPAHVDVWTAMQLNPSGPFGNNHVYPMIAQVATGSSRDALQAELDGIVAELPGAFPDAYSAGWIKQVGFHSEAYALKEYVVGDVARNLWILFGAVALLLLIACANVGNLFLARLETRKREFAVRAALGASRLHVARTAFAEGAVLAGAGAVLALVIGAGSTRWLTLLAPPGVPRLENLRVGGHVLLFVLGLAALIAVILAAVPATQFNSGSGVASLGDGGRGGTTSVRRKRLRAALVVTQVSLALMLVVGSGLLLRSYQHLRAVNPGIDARGVLTLETYLPYKRYDSLTKVWSFHDAVLEKIRAIPGVVSAGASEELPFLTGFGCTVQGFDDQSILERLREQHETSCAGQAPTTPGYFEALGIPLISGRLFTRRDNDVPETGAVIVTHAFAERFWPGENPIGKGVAPNGRTKPPFYHVVGVVGDVHGSAIDEPPAMGIFYPIVAIPGTGRWYPSEMHIVVKVARGDPLDILPAVRRSMAEVDPTIPIANAESMQRLVDRSMGRLAFTMMLLGIAGIVALSLAAIGLYGLISYIVARRTNEIGVRMALGAQQHQVVGLVVRGALGMTAIGVALGLAGAAATARVLGGLLYGIAPWDPLSYAAAVGVLSVVAGVAGWIPSRRAANVDPAVALRSE